jgi:hypothetical protein
MLKSGSAGVPAPDFTGLAVVGLIESPVERAAETLVPRTLRARGPPRG